MSKIALFNIKRTINIMYRKAGNLLVALLIVGATSTMTYGAFNPIKSYDLYADTHNSGSPSERDNVMSEYYSNSLSAQWDKNKTNSSNSGNAASGQSGQSMSSLPALPDVPKYNGSNGSNSGNSVRRNDYLRESSKKVYSDPSTPAGWVGARSYYSNPTLVSIKAKYKKSNFAGCLQECISYVQKHPNDTLGYYYLAMCYTKVNDKENAIKAYEKVIALNANPMIVKYATNGRNCVMQSGEKCYENVNEPELIYPYSNVADVQNLTPVDPNTLIQRNLNNLYGQLAPATASDEQSSGNGDQKDGKVTLPFGAQDAELDKFINSPYGNGLAPKLNNEYQEQQLKKIQETINDGSNSNERSIENIKRFDNQKSDADTMKIAYANTPETGNSDYYATQKEMDELNLLFENSKTTQSDDLVKYVTEQGGNLSPEVIQALMVKSMMPDFTFVNSDTKNLL